MVHVPSIQHMHPQAPLPHLPHVNRHRKISSRSSASLIRSVPKRVRSTSTEVSTASVGVLVWYMLLRSNICTSNTSSTRARTNGHDETPARCPMLNPLNNQSLKQPSVLSATNLSSLLPVTNQPFFLPPTISLLRSTSWRLLPGKQEASSHLDFTESAGAVLFDIANRRICLLRYKRDGRWESQWEYSLPEGRRYWEQTRADTAMSELYFTRSIGYECELLKMHTLT